MANRKQTIAFTVLGIRRKGEKFMKKRKKYSGESIGKIKIVEDFLPEPKDLVLKTVV